MCLGFLNLSGVIADSLFNFKTSVLGVLFPALYFKDAPQAGCPVVMKMQMHMGGHAEWNRVSMFVWKKGISVFHVVQQFVVSRSRNTVW